MIGDELKDFYLWISTIDLKNLTGAELNEKTLGAAIAIYISQKAEVDNNP